MRKIFSLVLACTLLLVSSLPKLESAEGMVEKHGPVIISLVAENLSIDGKNDFWLGFRMQMEPGWHTYWSDPGDVGVPPLIEWILPENLIADNLLFPCPSKVSMGKVVANGHRGETLFLCRFSCKSPLPQDSIQTIRAKVSWLVCSKVCLPGFANLSLELPVNRSGSEDPVWKERFDLFRRLQPIDPPNDWVARAYQEADEIRLSFPVESTEFLPEFYFFCKSGLIRSNAAQTLGKNTGFWEIKLQRSEWSSGAEKNITGLLRRTGGWNGKSEREYFLIDLPLE